jgi:signal transduction histidine kinase
LKESCRDIAAIFEKYRAFVAAFRAGDASESLADEIDALCKKVDLEFLLAEIPGAIDRSQEGNRRVAEVVRAMKEFAHPGAEEMVPTDVNHAIETTIAVARNEWKYVAEVETNLDPDLPPVPCVPGAFNQVVVNLIVNAAHAIADVVDKSGKDKGLIKVVTRRDAEWAEILVSDTGGGIPKEIRDRVFDPFFTTKDVGKGTGQGLAIAHSVIVERHGGAITFDSQDREGTTFTIRLPLTQKEPA